MTIWQDITNQVTIDELWVVNALTTAKQKLLSAAATITTDIDKVVSIADQDITYVSQWLTAHGGTLTSLFNAGVSALKIVGIDASPLITIAQALLNAAIAGAQALAQNLTIGSTPLSTITNAYLAFVAAEKAIKNVLTQAFSAPAGAAQQSVGS